MQRVFVINAGGVHVHVDIHNASMCITSCIAV